MDELIYVIGGIAYIAYSIYSASQKNKRKQQQAQQSSQPYAEQEAEESVKQEPASSIFQEIMGISETDFNVEEELFGRKKQEPKLQPQAIKAEPKPQKLDSIPKHEGVRTTAKQHTSIKDVEFVYEEEEEGIDYDFNLRDAIISAEILNPPYIER